MSVAPGTTRQLAFGFLFAAVAGMTGSATAQSRPGLTVRVTTREPVQQVVGLLRRSDSSSITVDSVTLPLSAVGRVELYQGTRGSGGTVALIGAALGFVTGYAIGEESGTSARGVVFGLIGAPALGLLGAACGATVRVERWSEVPLDQLRLVRVPNSTGAYQVGLRLAF